MPTRPIDGKDIRPLVSGQGGAGSPHEAIYYYLGWELQAVRSGKWKLHLPHNYRTLSGQAGGAGGKPVEYQQARIDLSLFDLESDVGEQRDLSTKHPDVVKRLLGLAERMRHELGDAATQTQGRDIRPPGRI
jgi:hypothetical protein